MTAGHHRVGTTAGPDLVDFYIRASAGFGEQVQAIGGEEWDLHTPCPDWDIKAIVAHVVLGESQVPEIVAGRGASVAEVDVSVLGREPIATWRGTALRAIETVRVTDPDQTVQHPLGTMPFRQVLGFRITDNLVHAWDIATARSVGLELEPELAEWCLGFWLPMAAELAESQFFAPMIEPSDDTTGARLLGLLGRSA